MKLWGAGGGDNSGKAYDLGEFPGHLCTSQSEQWNGQHCLKVTEVKVQNITDMGTFHYYLT
jgi:hypothetical protein